jgi:beta-lactamase superfamily II metal-dependent hydrolase
MLQDKIIKTIAVVIIMLGLTGCSGAAGQQTGTTGSDTLEMTFLNTGKSDCIVIDLGDFCVINDTADADDYELISAFLDQKGIAEIDYMILSHLDKDHIGSAAQLITYYDVACVLMPDYEETSEEYAALVAAFDNVDTEILRLKEDYSFAEGGADFYVSAPAEEQYEDDNNYSLITSIRYGENSFLLMGDAAKKRTGEFLTTAQGQQQYDLVKMPHHGDYNKNLDKFIESASPYWAVITAGAEQKKLEDKTLELLERCGCKTYDTAEGEVTVVSDGETVKVVQRK